MVVIPFDFDDTTKRKRKGDQDEDLWWMTQGPLPMLASIPANTGVSTLAFSGERAFITAQGSDSPSGQGWRGSGYMAKYEIDSSIQINGVFMNALTGIYVDPSNITLYLLDPAGITTSFAYTTAPGSPIIRDSLGHFHFTTTPGKSGTWTYKWQTTGSLVSTSPDTAFVVNPSALIAG